MGETQDHKVVVVGAGPAGVSTAVALKDVGVDPLLVDRAGQVVSSWRGRYDRLRLNTCRPFSHMPGRPFPKGTPMFPTRDQVVDYFERQAFRSDLEAKLGTRVERIERDGDGWAIQTSDGALAAPQVVVSTGFENEPLIPAWGDGDDFAGLVLHSSAYRNPGPFQGKKVLVVGPGCSGMEIAYDLAEGGAGKVWLSARTPPNILLRQTGAGIPGDMLGVAMLHLPARLGDFVTRVGRRREIGDLTDQGLPIPEEGVFSRLHRLGVAPAIIDKEVIEAIRARRFEVVKGVEELDGEGALLDGGGRIQPDVVICATGYRRGLEPLVGHLGVLDERGLPREQAAKPAAAGLRFVGYRPRPGGLGYMGKEAKRAAKAIARELRSNGRPRR
jgi:cation diffusion facilitator CzcD-associated flavoprotein CzcO